MSDSASSKHMYTCINMHGICVHKNPTMCWLKLVKHRSSRNEFDVGIRILHSSTRGVFHSTLLLYFNWRINKDYWLIDWLIALTVNQTTGGRRFSHFKRKYTYSRSHYGSLSYQPSKYLFFSLFQTLPDLGLPFGIIFGFSSRISFVVVAAMLF